MYHTFYAKSVTNTITAVRVSKNHRLIKFCTTPLSDVKGFTFLKNQNFTLNISDIF